jgi:hypothetical protein
MHARIAWLTVACLFLMFAPAAVNAADNELTPAEKNEGYILLFNGKDLTGWHRTTDGFGGWKAEDGAICLSKNGGMLYADEKFGNFVLKVDFKMAPKCNSGVFLRVGDPKNEVQTGLEIQVQDDYGRKPTRNSCGSIYDLVAPTKNACKPAGEWNSYVLTADKNRLTVELNGEKVAEMDLDQWTTPGKQPNGDKNKYKIAVKDFPRTGLIGLQDHGREVCFKNIKLKPLK